MAKAMLADLVKSLDQPPYQIDVWVYCINRHDWQTSVRDSKCLKCGGQAIGMHPPADDTERSAVSPYEHRANALADTLQTVRDQNTALLAENARLWCELERKR